MGGNGLAYIATEYSDSAEAVTSLDLKQSQTLKNISETVGRNYEERVKRDETKLQLKKYIPQSL